MDTICKGQCLEFIKELSLTTTPEQWGTPMLTVVIIWLITNILFLNRWSFLQQCNEAQSLVFHTMQIHIDRQQIYGTNVFERLAGTDEKYQHMLLTVLDAKTKAHQEAYSKRIDKLMNTTKNTRQYMDERQINTDADHLIDALNFRRWRGMFTDPIDIEMVLLILTKCKRIMAMQHSAT